MPEAFLHYLWQHLLFQPQLITPTGQTVTVISPGQYNHDGGPDFRDARIKIGDTLWAGDVEMHVKASEWYRHGHHNDTAYNTVILHVVWDYDQEVLIQGHAVDVVVLSDFVEPSVTDSYHRLLNTLRDIPCADDLPRLDSIYIHKALERALVERLMQRSEKVLSLLDEYRGDWNEVAYRLIGRGFGQGTNREVFFLLTKAVPFRVVSREANQISHLEALFFGQAGFLERRPHDNYLADLRSKWLFLVQKHHLPPSLDVSMWKFLRMRPANFPPVRIAQLAMFLHQNPNPFDVMVNHPVSMLRRIFRVQASAYWHHHDLPGRDARKCYPGTGTHFIDHMLINVVVPLLFCWHLIHQHDTQIDGLLDLMGSLSPENNKIVRKFTSLDVPNPHAGASQGMLQLYHGYCSQKKCLHCTIGAQLIR